MTVATPLVQAMSSTMHHEVMQSYQKERAQGGGVGGGGGGGGMPMGADGEDSQTHVSVMMDRCARLALSQSPPWRQPTGK